MQHGRGLAVAGAVGVASWSGAAQACGLSGAGMVGLASALQALLVVLLLSVISLLSLRAASRAFGRMLARQPSRGLRFARTACQLGYGFSILGTTVSGGLMVALLLL